jgi:leader peptidase (prepilin peptidase)/N-methyltransferase
MYINDISILYYFLVGVAGMLTGQFLDWSMMRLRENKRIVCREFFKNYLPNMQLNNKLVYSMAIINIILLYFGGFNLQTLEYLLLAPILLLIFVIDYKDKIIPNRLALTVFEIGIIFTVILGYTDFNIAINNIIGLIVGGAVFGIITLIGKLIANKEAMGFGDVKLMAALGLVMGFPKILMIAITAFLIGAFVSIVLLIIKKKKAKDVIPFGPFIVISTIIVMFIPTNILLLALLNIFTLGIYHA